MGGTNTTSTLDHLFPNRRSPGTRQAECESLWTAETSNQLLGCGFLTRADVFLMPMCIEESSFPVSEPHPPIIHPQPAANFPLSPPKGAVKDPFGLQLPAEKMGGVRGSNMA